MSILQLPFDQRACFIAGQAKSGTTLLAALLDGHPELLVLPQETLLVTIRDPRAILATQIALEKTRETKRFSVYYVIAHWRVAARLARRVRSGEVSGLVVPFEQLITDPSASMQRVCDYLEIAFDPEIVLKPTKIGQLWSGTSAAAVDFSEISAEPAIRWHRELSEDEIGWVEWHCRDLMPEFGYEPRLSDRALRHFLKPIRGERPREYLKSRAYSLRDDWIR